MCRTKQNLCVSRWLEAKNSARGVSLQVPSHLLGSSRRPALRSTAAWAQAHPAANPTHLRQHGDRITIKPAVRLRPARAVDEAAGTGCWTRGRG